MQAKVYVAGAEKDGSFDDEQFERLAEGRLTEADVDHTLVTYPALHGFAVPDNPTYDEAAADPALGSARGALRVGAGTGLMQSSSSANPVVIASRSAVEQAARRTRRLVGVAVSIERREATGRRLVTGGAEVGIETMGPLEVDTGGTQHVVEAHRPSHRHVEAHSITRHTGVSGPA